MVKQLPAPAKDFSSIARRLLLNHNSWENSQLRATSSCDSFSSDELNTFGPISFTTPRQVKRKHHRCDLCDRLRSLTAEKLTAPIEKPYEVVKPNKGLVGRPSLGRKTKVIVKRVREFFEELKKQIGELGYGTILNSAAVMTGLACGVSCKTVTRITKGPECKKKSIVDRYTIRKANFKKYGPEWGEMVLSAPEQPDRYSLAQSDSDNKESLQQAVPSPTQSSVTYSISPEDDDCKSHLEQIVPPLTRNNDTYTLSQKDSDRKSLLDQTDPPLSPASTTYSLSCDDDESMELLEEPTSSREEVWDRSPTEELNACDLISGAVSQQQGEQKGRCCELCSRIRSLTAERLTAPLEKPYDSLTPRRRVHTSRPAIGRNAKILIRRVRKFFDELKKQLGNEAHGTILSCANVMTVLACGVSANTISRIPRELPEECKVKELEGKNEMQAACFKRFDKEWSVPVRYFVSNLMKHEKYIAIGELHSKLCFAFADFPMSPPMLHAFLGALGFSYRKVGNKNYIVESRKNKV
ncbi:hypothetical protein RB195_015448 [Necator americanus]|uniref:Uncharacterized protein n=1 Tax=Necator americanus TaxID=51031 RepID=A0ABR1E574_NECAM